MAARDLLRRLAPLLLAIVIFLTLWVTKAPAVAVNVIAIGIHLVRWSIVLARRWIA